MRNSNFKIHILYNLQEGPWGGGNQFLKALKNEFLKNELYETSPRKADIILFNSHQELLRVNKFKYDYPDKILIHRVDGPISKIRNKDLELDKIIYVLNDLIADGTIFQSHWSRGENNKLGMKKNKYETIIINAPDPKIFNRKKSIGLNKNRKIRLIATSWSANPRKGFDIYKYLDEKLDANKYEMTFIGNSPVKFKNIKWIKPLESQALAEQIKKHDIFIIASQKDPCSNSLIEALHCGLPAVTLNDGGHPEIIENAGEIFDDENYVINKIEKIANNYEFYQGKINLPDINAVAEKYYQFFKMIYEDYRNKKYNPKVINKFQYYRISLKLLIHKIKTSI